MDVIFEERAFVGLWAWPRMYGGEVLVVHEKISVFTTAYYNHATRVLCVDQSPACDVDVELPERRVLETHETSAQAIRRAVELADEWRDQLAALIPAARSDATVITEWRARQADEIPF